MLSAGIEDLRGQPLAERRRRLEQEKEKIDHDLFDLSELPKVTKQAELARHRDKCRQGGLIEGVMLKDKHSPYKAGREKGLWYKWKRDPLYADLVIMYAQRDMANVHPITLISPLGMAGFCCESRLVPVCKAYSGFTDL